MRFDSTPIFVRAGKITVTSQQSRLDGKNTIIDTIVEETTQCPVTPPFDLYTLEDEIKSGVKLQQVSTKVLTSERPDADFYYRPTSEPQTPPIEPQTPSTEPQTPPTEPQTPLTE